MHPMEKLIKKKGGSSHCQQAHPSTYTRDSDMSTHETHCHDASIKLDKGQLDNVRSGKTRAESIDLNPNTGF